jgi:glucosylceramidase
MVKKYFIAIFFLLKINPAFCQTVTWVTSTDKNRWVENKPLLLQALPVDLPCDAQVILGQAQQTIDGWGGCFNELGWDALKLLSVNDREKVISSFFGANGLKYTICRMPIGANDYARSWYSLDDTPFDFSLKKFNISRDLITLIPYIKAAMKYQPALKIWGSPWSPPAWMKINNNYACQADETNNLAPAKAIRRNDMFIQEAKYLSTYAQYLSKYVKAYREQGINVFAVAIQNEPYAFSRYPTCLWSAHALRDFIAKYAGPTFKKEHTNAQIWLGTINNNRISVFDTVLNDQSTQKYISAVGVQWAGKNAIGEINRKYPQLKKIQTETECGNGTFDWAAAEYTFGLMKHYFNNGVSAYMYWNMVLEDNGKSNWGWVQNAQVIINKETRQVTYTPEYYLFKHFSFFVQPGAVKLKTEGSFDNMLAFKNADGKMVIVAANTQDKPQKISIKVNGSYFQADLEAKSFNSFIF